MEIRKYLLRARNYCLYLPEHNTVFICFDFFRESSLFPLSFDMLNSFLFTLNITIPPQRQYPHTLHQRPPSVGMPGIALRRRITNMYPKRVGLDKSSQITGNFAVQFCSLEYPSLVVWPQHVGQV